VKMQRLVTATMVRFTFSRTRLRCDEEQGGGQAKGRNGSGNSLARWTNAPPCVEAAMMEEHSSVRTFNSKLKRARITRCAQLTYAAVWHAPLQERVSKGRRGDARCFEFEQRRGGEARGAPRSVRRTKGREKCPTAANTGTVLHTHTHTGKQQQARRAPANKTALPLSTAAVPVCSSVERKDTSDGEKKSCAVARCRAVAVACFLA